MSKTRNYRWLSIICRGTTSSWALLTTLVRFKTTEYQNIPSMTPWGKIDHRLSHLSMSDSLQRGFVRESHQHPPVHGHQLTPRLQTPAVPHPRPWPQRHRPHERLQRRPRPQPRDPERRRRRHGGGGPRDAGPQSGPGRADAGRERPGDDAQRVPLGLLPCQVLSQLPVPCWRRWLALLARLGQPEDQDIQAYWEQVLWDGCDSHDPD